MKEVLTTHSSVNHLRLALSLYLELDLLLKLIQCFMIIVYSPVSPGKTCASGDENLHLLMPILQVHH